MSPPDRAVIVAAGRSTRLYPTTLDTPKCLLDVGGKPMIVRSVECLRDAGIQDIAIVVGFQHEKIEATLGEDRITYIHNPFFAGTNNLGSLWFAKRWVGRDAFLYLHGDLVYDPALLVAMLDDPSPGAMLLVDEKHVDDEAMKVRVDEAGHLIESCKEIPLEEAAGEWVGITTFSASCVEPLFETIEEVLAEGLLNAYDTEAFTRMALRGHPFRIVPTDERPWIEIDFHDDLDRARELFGSATAEREPRSKRDPS